MNKNELLDKIRVGHRQLIRYLFYFERGDDGEFVASTRPKFSPAEMTQPGVVGQWSLKDLLAHLADAEGRLLNWYAAGLRSQVPQAPALDALWDDLDTSTGPSVKAHRDRPIEDVLAERPRSFRQTLETIAAIPEADLFDAGRFAWTRNATLADYVAAHTYERYDWAKRHIRRWRKSHAGKGLNKEKILERIRVERRRLEKNLSGLSPDEMAQPGVVGEWSVKDVLAHLVDWEQRFLGWYQAGLRGEVPATPAPGLTWSQLDILNRQIYEKHRQRSLEDVWAEFEASYQQVLAVVQAIPEGDMFLIGRYAWTGTGNLAGYILANTANHYRWAKTLIRKWMKTRGGRP